VPGLGRFRCNVFQQRGTVGLVLRVIPVKIMTVRELGLPMVLEKISQEQRGLILCTGTTGSGKSTTLAAMIDYINSQRCEHIITIEDPIEFLHRDKKSIVNQREVEVDTRSFAAALRSALRQDPDVILVGEMRDYETIETAITAAETGHLVLSTLHTLDATETVNRIISVFPPHQQKQIRLQLAGVLKAVVSMRLIPRADGHGRVPAVEVMIATPFIRDCIINKDKTKLIHEAIAAGVSQYGMQTFDQSIFQLYKKELISYDEALRRASNPTSSSSRSRASSPPPTWPPRRWSGRCSRSTWNSRTRMPRRAAATPPPTAYQRALRRLARRDHSAAELRRALLDRGHGKEEIEAALDRLRRERYVDDAGFAERFARSRMAHQGHGRLRIRQDLRLRGVDRRTTEAGIAGALLEVDEEALVDSSPADTGAARGRRVPRRLPRLWAFLVRRGFAPGLVRERLSALWPRWSDALEGLEPSDDPGRPW